MRNNRRKHQQDALRWLMGVLVTSLLASAVTSAVFMAARRDPPPVDPLRQRLENSAQIVHSITGDLQALAISHIEQANAAAPNVVEATYLTEPATTARQVSTVAPDDNTLMEMAFTPWTLQVTSTTGQRRFARIVEIRDAGSLTSPGFIGVVEYAAETAQRQLAISGELPLQKPEDFQVSTSPKYTELAASAGANVRPASATVSGSADAWVYVDENWTPATPPPAELPETVRRQYNETIARCVTSEPTTAVSTERLTFFYSLRERKWMPRR